MDFQKLLSVADWNKNKAQHEASISTYNSDLPPPKKVPKSNVMSENIRKFLEKKKAEEAARAAEERRRKEQLLALRAQNTKNSKKAKIMASRTKDNDFSKIKLTEEEIEAKRQRELELRKTLSDKVERMKARIEMEEREKLLPKKRKRKSKNVEGVEIAENSVVEEEIKEDVCTIEKHSDKSISEKKIVRKPRPAAPSLSFHDLLKVAQNKQFEPIEIIPQKKQEERPLSRKEKRELEMEQDRIRRKEEKMKYGKISKTVNKLQIENKKTISDNTNKPVVVHVTKESSKKIQEPVSKSKIPNVLPSNNNRSSLKDIDTKSHSIKSLNKTSLAPENSSKHKTIINQKIINAKVESQLSNVQKTIPKKNGLKINSVSAPLCKQPAPSALPLNTELIQAELERKLREEMEKKFDAKLAEITKLLTERNSVKEDDKEQKQPAKTVEKKPLLVNGVKHINKPSLNSNRDADRTLAMKKQIMEQKKQVPKLPEKKVFHKNPYLDPPRRLLEPQRPLSKPQPKRRIESDDDDDDDMSDFIDDGPSQNEEDYSKYIQEIFGYDKNRYVDDDDDDIRESSFAEQMKEEVRSAKLGYLEDLEEERKEMARKKKKKIKK